MDAGAGSLAEEEEEEGALEKGIRESNGRGGYQMMCRKMH